MVSLSRNSLIIFLFLALTVISISYFVVNSSAFSSNPGLLSMASTIDLVILIPIIYFLCIRKRKIPKITVVPVFVLSFLLAGQIIPNNQQQTLQYIQYAIPLLELGVISYMIYLVINLSRAVGSQKYGLRDFPEMIYRVILKKSENSILAHVGASESSLFYYTFAGWKTPKALGENEFSYYKTSGQQSVFVLILFLLPVETVALHWWLASFSEVLAWVLTGLSVYSVFFIIGDRNSMRHRPMVIGHESLNLQMGIRWKVEVPFSQIQNVSLREADDTSEKFANLSSFGFGNVVLELASPITLRGIYGIKKTTDKIALSIDERSRFVQLLEERMSA